MEKLRLICSNSRIPSIIRNSKVHNHVHNISPLVPIMIQVNVVRILPLSVGAECNHDTRYNGIFCSLTKEVVQVRCLVLHFVNVRYAFFCSRQLLAPRQIHKPGFHPLSAAVFHLLTALVSVCTLRTWRPSSAFVTCGGTIPWRWGIHFSF